METTPDRQPDMAISCTVPFCRSPNTPPSSPEEYKHSIPPQPSRLRLPKFLTRVQPTRSPSFLMRHQTQDGMHGNVQESASLETAAQADSTSPFRAVREMKEPFPLLLPASPAESQQGPLCRVFGDQVETSDVKALRSVPLSYSGLATSQSGQRPLKRSPSKPMILLPSPAFSEIKLNEATQSYFDCHQSQLSRPPTRDLRRASSSDENPSIASYYCQSPEQRVFLRDGFNVRDVSRKSSAPSMLERADGRRDRGITSAPSSFKLPKSCPTRDRTRTLSSEADWLSGTMSEKAMCEEWLDNIPPRRHQLIQHPMGQPEFQHEDNRHEIVSIM